MIILSFISAGPNLQSQLARALYDTPLHSVFSLNITKQISELDLDDDDGIVDNYDADVGNNDEVLEWLVGSIERWKTENKTFFNRVDGLNLLPIFAKMFNQVFTQISFLKTKLTSRKYKDEHLSDFACRFEYIVNNAALIQMNDVKVVLANTAQTHNYDTFRNNKKFFKSNNTIARNISAVENSEHENAELANLFYNALSTHPIFQMNVSISRDNQAIRKPSYRLLWQDKKQSPKQASDEFELLINKAIASSKSFSGQKKFDRNDFINWFNYDFNAALQMANKVVRIVDNMPEIEPKGTTVKGKALDVMRHYVYTS
ncbi:hypothetical protein [Vibrio harveyi]|uniref:Uncharacterized protein n=1 Tax=Vibrio harveyi TaxID=669 RepID=A0A8B3DAG7_VIBHA|nr:hypothetical protein [Vibrio harveyi]RIW05829.1 hypothetical protein DS957_022330 [Vibrio harveyi]